MSDLVQIKQADLDVIADGLHNITSQHKEVGKLQTPKGLIKRVTGFDYVDISYLKKIANEQFPGWSWTIIKSEALGTEAYVVHGRLKWLDNGLWREGDMVAAHRIQKKKGTDSSYVNVGNDIKAANTDCMKKAFNMYMDIANDVYRNEDPTLDDEQRDEVLGAAMKIGEGKYDEIYELVENETINTGNYKASVAKLRRLFK